MAMGKTKVIQGRKIISDDIHLIQQLLYNNPSWGRTKLSEELCKIWNWRTPKKQLKDMACRSLLLKLERLGYIVLPARKRKSTNAYRNRSYTSVPHTTDKICCNIKTLIPIQITPVHQRADDLPLFNCLLSQYHYLGYRNSVGQNMKYLVRGAAGRPLACLLFGSAAWKTAPRDTFIGWSQSTRESNLKYLTNNMRFLILPWVKVPNLASHILSGVSRRIHSDWIDKYGHPIYLLETFVDRSRFSGTCYKAANWILTGQTKGRTRSDKNYTVRVPVKNVYVYPLTKNFRQELCRDA